MLDEMTEEWTVNKIITTFLPFIMKSYLSFAQMHSKVGILWWHLIGKLAETYMYRRLYFFTSL